MKLDALLPKTVFQVHLQNVCSVFTNSSEHFGDLVTNSLKLFYHIYHIQGHFNCQKAFSIYYYYPVDATERLAPLCSSGATSLAVGKSSCASLV